jgi:hypothetical protein
MVLRGNAVPPTLWDFSLSARRADFALAKFRALPKNRNACTEDRALQGWNSSADASPDGRSKNRLPQNPVSCRDRSRFFVQSIGSTSLQTASRLFSTRVSKAIPGSFCWTSPQVGLAHWPIQRSMSLCPVGRMTGSGFIVPRSAAAKSRSGEWRLTARGRSRQ